MATKRKFPDSSVPLVGKDGRISREWYQALVTESHVGPVATSAGAGGNFVTITVNGEQKLVEYLELPP